MNFSNISGNATDEFWNRVSWIAAVSINAVLTAVTMWILFSLIHYGVRTGKWSGAQKRNADKLNAGWVYSSVLACAVISIIRYMTSQIVFQIGFGETKDHDQACESVNDLLFVEYSLVLFSTYIFLWLRQRTFYTNEMFNINYSKSLRILSASSILILLLAGLGVVIINTLPSNYSSTPHGCIYDPESVALDISSWAACAAVLVVGQVLLLSLLIYPLAKNLNDEHCLKQICCFLCIMKEEQKKIRQQLPNSASPSKSSIGSNETSGHTTVVHSISGSESPLRISTPKPKKKRTTKRKSSVAVKRIMFRTLVFGVLAVFTDLFLISVLSTNVINNSDPVLRRVATTLYDINVFLNLMLVIMSFMTYKKMLLSPCKSKIRREEPSSRTTYGSSTGNA